MDPESAWPAIVAGTATFLIVGIAGTALARPWIELSMFLALPVGAVAGAIAAGLVFLSMGAASARRRRVALSFTAFTVGFLLALVVGGAANIGGTPSVLAGVVVGLLVAISTYLLAP